MPYTQWTEEVYKDIARATWEVGKLSPDQVGNIMSKLHDIGHTFSADALRQHLQKLNRQARGPTGGKRGSASSSATTRPKAPSRAPPSRKTATKTGTKRTADVALQEKYDDGEDDDEEDKPKKRIKANVEELPSNMGPASNDEAAGPPQDLLLPGPPSDDEVEYTFVPDGDNDNDNGDGNGNGDDEDYERNLAFLHSVYSRQPGDDEDEDEGLI
ncbi:hypothetical protein F4819DRAFT_192257 [Hypoxylon fuscum]|nr:hypothetical protein F4819DRAFT_192257 [Hypoxylon fuscum]